MVVTIIINVIIVIILYIFFGFLYTRIVSSKYWRLWEYICGLGFAAPFIFLTIAHLLPIPTEAKQIIGGTTILLLPLWIMLK